MKCFKTGLKRLVYIVGYITTISIIISILLFAFLKIKYSEKYNFSYNDGPYVFYLNDSSIKSIIVDKAENKDFYIKEETINLNDSTLINKSIRYLPAGFKPSEKFTKSGEFQFYSERIAAISDLHGSYNHLKSILKSNKIIDDSLNWNWGKGHLVVIGDVFDKGPSVTECFWLIKKLEAQADEKGGKVHLLLGNHEMYILRGNSSYIDVKYREICDRLLIRYDQLYGPDTYLGKWLRTKMTVVQINKNLFVHGGISDKIIENHLSLSDINRYMFTYFELNHFINSRPGFIDTLKNLICVLGPLEYKGYFNANLINRGESSRYSDQMADSVLHHFNIEHIIVGHTIVKDIKGLFDNRLIAIDKALPEDDITKKNSDCQMLIIENSNYYRADINGKKKLLFSDTDRSFHD